MIVTAVLADPPVLVAVMVQVASAESWVGVPEIAPVAAESTRPAGSAGAAVNVGAGVPELVGAASVQATPRVQMSDVLA